MWEGGTSGRRYVVGILKMEEVVGLHVIWRCLSSRHSQERKVCNLSCDGTLEEGCLILRPVC